MSASWELVGQADVLVGILHTDLVSIAWSFGLRNLIIPGRGAILPIAGMPYDMARNHICQAAIDGNFTHCMHIDSDVVPQRDAIQLLLRHKLPIVSGIYCRRSPPHGLPVMMKNGQWVTRYPANSLIEVDVVGAGLLLLSTDMLRKLPPSDPVRGKHWFDWRVDMPNLPKGHALSEDYRFCQHAKNHSFRIMVDTSVQARHIGLAQATYGNLLPAEASSVT